MSRILLFLTVATISFSASANNRNVEPTPPHPPTAPNIAEVNLTNEHVVETYSQTTIYRLIRNFMRTMRTNFNVRVVTQDPTGAGESDAISDLSLAADLSYGDFDDDALGGGGYDYTTSAYATGRINETIDLTLGISYSEYRLESGFGDVNQDSTTLDIYGSYNVTDAFALGLFFQYGNYDVEPVGFTHDDFNRFAVGVSGSYRFPTEFADYGISATLASFNRTSLSEIWHDENSALLTTFDAQKMLTDNISVDLYTTVFTMLQANTGQDPNYFIVGADGSYIIDDNWLVTLGYETVLGYNGYGEDRINASLIYTW